MDERIKEINKNSLLLFKSVYISDNKPEKQISLKDKIYLTNECLNSGIVLHPEIFDTYFNVRFIRTYTCHKVSIRFLF